MYNYLENCNNKISRNVRKRTNEDSNQPAHASLSTWSNFASVAFLDTPREDSDQTAQTRSLIWIFAGRTCPKYVFWRFGSNEHNGHGYYHWWCCHEIKDWQKKTSYKIISNVWGLNESWVVKPETVAKFIKKKKEDTLK